jgi:hypothetical protein
MSQPLSKPAVAINSKAPKPLFTSKGLMQCPHRFKAYWYNKNAAFYCIRPACEQHEKLIPKMFQGW